MYQILREILGENTLMSKKALITIIVPVFNEEDNIQKLLTKLMNVVQKDLLEKKKWNTEIIIVNDGSTDNSLEILHSLINNQKHIKIIQHKKNRGKGAAISTALRESTGDICIIQDADLEYNPLEIPKILEPIVRGEVHVVFGSRFLNFRNYNGLWSHLLGNKGLSVISSLILRRRVSDIMTCYKAFIVDLLQNINSRSFDIEPEITAKLLFNRNVRFIELPISYNPRLKGKKIKKLDGVISLLRLIKTILIIQKERRREN